MENSADDIILPETSEIVHEEAPVPAPKKSSHKKLLLVVASVIGFLVLAGSLVFIILNSSKSTEPGVAEKETPAGKYDSGEIQEMFTMVDARIASGDYAGAKQLLEAYRATERMTASQRYRYYTLFSKIYAPAALDDSGLEHKYATLAEYARALILKGEE